MSPSAAVFYLDVQLVEKYCLFELSWGQGPKLNVKLPYPETLSTLYQQWRMDYISFYKTTLRGRVAENGTISTPPADWRGQLVEAEAEFLTEFRKWLCQGELFDIRACLARSLKQKDRERGEDGEKKESSPFVEVFLTCDPLDLARLPWETWDIGKEFGAEGRIRIVRTPPNIQEEPPESSRNRRHRTRILAIWGDDTGLNFKAEKKALRSLSKIADIEFVGWQAKPENEQNTERDTEQEIAELKQQIIEAIIDEQGWDILLFAGHSNEKGLVGGELTIAPNASLFISEIEQALLVAKERGLQFALFNSCKGLDIANTLISLGLSQVVVMREPVHNQVAQEFLVRFLQGMAQYKDVHESMVEACQYLKHLRLEKTLTYPSASLVPSLFRYPNTPLFRLKPSGFRYEVGRWLPTRKEAIALAALAVVSWQLSVQNFLTERRVMVQAMYRQQTGQVAKTTSPPLLLVQIDDQSIIEEGIKDPTPMDREYLAKLVDKLSTWKPKVVAIDYLLDRPHEKQDKKNPNQPSSDRILANSLAKAVQQHQTYFVFAANRDDTVNWVGVQPEIAGLDWTLQGDMDLLVWQGKPGYMRQVPRIDNSSRNVPFSYLIALAWRLNFDPTFSPPQPQAHQSAKPFISQLIEYLNGKHHQNYTQSFSSPAHRHPITAFAHSLGQMWLQPIIDFSIPPNQIYERIPAWKLLQMDSNRSLLLDRRAVMIAAGGYGDDPGIPLGSQDNFPVPAAVGYWRKQQNHFDPRRFITGGEVHAYMFHTFQTQRFVIPIPDLWLVVVAALLGKGTALALQGRKRRSSLEGIVLLVSATTTYGLISLQIYIWTAVLVPWFLPSVTYWTFVVPLFLRRKYKCVNSIRQYLLGYLQA